MVKFNANNVIKGVLIVIKMENVMQIALKTVFSVQAKLYAQNVNIPLILLVRLAIRAVEKENIQMMINRYVLTAMKNASLVKMIL